MTECDRCKRLEAQLAHAERLWEADRVAMRKAIAAAQLEYKRTAEAHADVQLAWQRVTELQARGTELVLERRAAEDKRAELVSDVRGWNEAHGEWRDLASLLDACEAQR